MNTFFETYTTQGDSWNGLGKVQKLKGIAEPIYVVALPGHTRGHSGVLIEEGTNTLFTGDSFLLEAQLLKKPYAVAVNLYNQLTHDNPTQAEETLNKIRLIHTQDSELVILSSHDPVLFRRSLEQEETEK